MSSEIDSLEKLKQKWGYDHLHITLGDEGKNMTEAELASYMDGVFEAELNGEVEITPIDWDEEEFCTTEGPCANCDCL